MEALLEECRGVKTKWLYGVVKSITVGGCNTSYMYGDSWTVAEFAEWCVVAAAAGRDTLAEPYLTGLVSKCHSGQPASF